ncbi:MAG: BatD family protein [Polyangiaceae bacterium]
MSLPRKAASRALFAWLALATPMLATGTFQTTAIAQTPPQVTSKASDDEAEVGEPFTIEITAMSETDDPVSNPELRAPQGFSISGPSISQQSYFSFGAGGRKSYRGVGATWTLVGSTPGTFNIPAPTIQWNGQKLKGSPVTIKIVPQGTRPQRQQGGFLFPGMPGFGSNWPFGGGGGFDDDDSDQPGDDPALALPKAPNDDIFLHAIVDKKTAVVGEQVTISVYRYSRTRAVMDLGVKEQTPMTMADFLRYDLVKDPGVQTTTTARAGNSHFRVRLLGQYALFPLRAGKLSTGSMTETYQSQTTRRQFKRASEDIVIQVTEPPAANRPVGYRIGDVGQFQISALVQPRKVEEGGSVAVTVRLTGTGNFPTSLNVPAKTGVEWLDPEKKESIEPRAGDIAGFRSFGYVVRLTQRGTVDLGNIEFPYWNPRARRYETAKTTLGTVEVTPSTAPVAPVPSASAQASSETESPFKNLPPARTTLSPFTPPAQQTVLLEGPRYVVALAAPPFLAVLGIASVEASRRLKSRMASRKSSPRTLANTALDEARKAKSSRDERAAAAAIERAIVIAIEGATGLKARGVLKEALAPELIGKGIKKPVAERAAATLSACDSARFDPLAAADLTVEDAESLVADLLAAKGA